MPMVVQNGQGSDEGQSMGNSQWGIVNGKQGFANRNWGMVAYPSLLFPIPDSLLLIRNSQ